MRTLGTGEGERFGVGLMDKTGQTGDYLNRAHGGYVIVGLLRGGGLYRDAAGLEFPLCAGCVFQRFKNVPHSSLIDPASGWLECFLELGDSVAALLEKYGCIDRTRPVGAIEVNGALVARFQALGRSFAEESDAELVGRIPEIVELAQHCLAGRLPEAAEDERRRIIELACAHLARDFRNPAELAEFCRRHGWGYENFRKYFKQQTGVSPHRYRIRRRIDAACALLADPTLSISAIAEHLGYSSPYEFSAQFKQELGVAPSHYR